MDGAADSAGRPPEFRNQQRAQDHTVPYSTIPYHMQQGPGQLHDGMLHILYQGRCPEPCCKQFNAISTACCLDYKDNPMNERTEPSVIQERRVHHGSDKPVALDAWKRAANQIHGQERASKHHDLMTCWRQERGYEVLHYCSRRAGC